MRTITILSFIIILLVSLGLADDGIGFQDISSYLTTKPNTNAIEAIWDLQDSLNLEIITGALGNAGAEFDGTYYYTTRWGTNLLHKIDLAGNLVEEFSIPGVTGLRDLAFDGTFMYGGAGANTIYIMDIVGKTLVGTIPSPVGVRHIAYDDAANGLWVGNWADPPTLIDMSGTTLAVLSTAFASQYGSAYDGFTTGGPFLWVFEQGLGAGNPQTIHQIEIASGTATGVIHDVTQEFPTNSGIAGGLWIGTGIVPGTVSIGGLLQGTPDMFFVYELGPLGGGNELQLISPNGGEIWQVASAQLVQWISNNGPPLIRIDYSIDGGTNWIFIDTDIPVISGQYAWQIPDTPSQNCLMRISDAVDGNPFDVSDASFIISAIPQINVLTPNGGETWLVGSGETIQWSTTSPTNPQDVKIEYSADGGGAWIEITASTPNDGDFVWSPIPNTPSNNCLVRISDALDGIPSDTSDTPFTIGGTELLLLSPNGGENWQVGTPELIRWSSGIPNDPPNVKLEYSIDGGGNWTEIIASTPNSGEYAWTIIALPSTNCLVRVSDAVDGDPFDVSDAAFTLFVPTVLTVSRPNGGENFSVGATELIQWSSTIPSQPPSVKLEYSTNGGTSWNEIIASTPNDGEYAWTIPNDPSTDCLVKVSDAADGDPADISDASFTIRHATITVTAPANGQSWEVNSTLTIEWGSTGNVGNVNIEISRDNGSSYTTIYANTANDGSEDWIVQMPRSDQCRIRVSDVQTPSVFDLSGTFIIDPEYREEGITKSAAQHSGSSQSDYRLFSVPLNLADPRPVAVLEDDLGPYNNTVWRFWDYENNAYVEYPDTRDFDPDRSFFLIVRDAGKIIDSGPGELIADSVYTVDLDSGWNFIANPYNFPIPISALSLSTNLQTFNSNGWVAHTTELLPWEGYILWSGTPATLIIRPGIPGSTVLAKQSSATQPDWSVQIKAQSQMSKDYNNVAGVIEGAAEDWDQFDGHEPPHIAEYVSVYFPHQDWNRYPDNYSIDLKPSGQLGYSWDFDIKSNIVGEIDITFAGMSDIPAEFEVRLIDPAMNYVQDLRQKDDYGLYCRSEEQHHPMTLIVGTADYIQQSLQGLELASSEFRLYDNFPNPFNLSTTIPFNLVQAENVSLRIYNLLGEEVANILNHQYYEAGLHKVYWDGRNNAGIDLASGIYLYRLETGNHTEVKKMLLVK